MAEDKKKGASLKEALAAQDKLVKLEQELLALEGKRGKRATERRAIIQQEIKSSEELVKNSKDYNEYNKKINKGSVDFVKSYSKLSKDVRRNLGGEMKNSTILASINTKRVQLEAQQAGLTGDALLANQEMVARLQEQETSLIQQAKQTANAEAKARGMNDLAIELKEIEEQIVAARKAGNKELEETLELEKEGIELRQQMSEKEERLASIQSSTKEIMDAMPEGVKSAVSFGQDLASTMKTAGAGAAAFMILASVITAALSEFKKVDDAAKEFRETTGLTNTQMKGIKDDSVALRGYFAEIGVEAKDVFNTVAALKGEFSDVAEFSQETVGALTVLSANFGVSADSAAKVQNQLEAIGGLSSETAANVNMQIASMSKLAGVAPKKVFEDIAENAEATSTFFKGDIKLLANQAVQARRLGTNLKAVTETAEKLLDFESGIEEELVAATFVGGQFNLSRARALAMEGKLVEAQAETLSQIQRSGDFRKKDYFTQQQLAKAAGMSVEEINKQLNAQEKLSTLSSEQRKAAEDAINKGLDITNISADQLALETEKFSMQQEQQSQLDALQNSFSSIAATVGTALVPALEAIVPLMSLIAWPVQVIAEGIKFFVDNLAIGLPLLAAYAIYMAKTKKDAIVKAVTGIWDSFMKIPYGIGVPLAIAAVAGLYSMISKATAVGDISSPASGKTMVSTKEGGLFELSPNDDLVAAPGAVDALQNGGGATLEGGGSPNLAALSAPLNAMINEIKALRADLNAGKIAVYMDTSKVSSNIASNVDQSSRNSYNLGSA